ncbi:MAG: LysR family transcriptional regulator [Paucimonas sp.]|nr:LysR family transcriptional regulator [Paucimonas sp.]
MNLSQRQLQAFLVIARLGSFTRAAERLHITQSGLSAMTRDLEKQLDCRLFDRTTRSVALTAAGTQLVPVAARVLAELEAVSDSINRISTRARQILTVGATPLIASDVLPAASAVFTAQHPGINLRIRDLGRQQIQDEVANGTLDVGFGAFFKPASGLERVALAEFPLAFVCPASSDADARRRAPRKMKWTELRDKPLIGLAPENPVQQMIEEHLRRAGRADEERPAYENMQTVLAMVEARFGVAVLPAFVAPACARYAVQLHLLIEPQVPLAFYQITRKGRAVPDGTAALARALKAALQQAPARG